MFHDGLAKSREVAVKSIAAAKDGVETMGKASPVANKEASALTSKAFEQMMTNTEAAYEAVQAIARAKSPMEAVQLQTQYFQAQMGRVGEQSKELFDLSTKFAQKSAEGVTQMAAKSGASFKL
jgi:hypothetical protein